MIRTGETVVIEAVALEEEQVKQIRGLPGIFSAEYEEQTLTVRCSESKHNLLRILGWLQERDIPFGQVFSQLPTLNDVFLEITGKQLRD